MIITFSGPSGAGKSTLIAELLKTDIFKNKKVVVKEEDDFFVINIAKRVLGENIFTKYKDEWYFQKKHEGISYKVFKGVSKICYPLVVYLEFLLFYIYYEILFRDKLLITDRFVYDSEVSFRTLMNINGLVFTYLYDCFPRTYHSFLIMIDLDNAAVKRNKNNRPGANTSTKGFHENVLKLYEKIGAKHKLLVIDNNRNLKKSIEEIKSHIINKEKLLQIHEISLCGMDGAGKTTIATKICEYAEQLNIHCGVAHFVHNNVIYKLLLRFGLYENSEDIKETYKRKREHSLRERQKQTSFTRAFLRFADSYIQYIYYKIIFWNKLVIYDRYFYDYVVSFEYLTIPHRTLFNKLIPNVKNRFLILPNPLTSYKRKPERVKEFFIDNYKLYKKMARDLNMEIINTENKNPESAFQEVIKKLK